MKLDLIHEALNALGPKTPECCGCKEEWETAITALQKFLLETNTSLIDAAPDLLEALLEYKRLYEEVQPSGGWQGVYEIGNAVIAKATGGEV